MKKRKNNFVRKFFDRADTGLYRSKEIPAKYPYELYLQLNEIEHTKQ